MITINNIQYKLKFTLRAMLIFEQVTKKSFKIESLTDEYVYLYSMLMANNPDCELSFDDLIDAMDNDPSIINTFKEELDKYNKKQSIYQSEDKEDSKKNF